MYAFCVSKPPNWGFGGGTRLFAGISKTGGVDPLDGRSAVTVHATTTATATATAIATLLCYYVLLFMVVRMLPYGKVAKGSANIHVM